MPWGLGHPIDCKDLTFNREQGCAFYKGQRIELSDTPFQVLYRIHGEHSNLVSNEAIRRDVWHNANRDPNLPQQQVTKLNKILPPFGLYVHSVRNRGYLIARVEQLSHASRDKYGTADLATRTSRRSSRDLSNLDSRRDQSDTILFAPIRVGLDELISIAGLSAFYPSRDYYSLYRDASTIDQYVSTATRSVVMVSINLMTGIPIDGVCEALKRKIKSNAKFTAIVSLLNPDMPHLMASLAPVLATTPVDLAHSIRLSLNRLNEAKMDLKPKDRARFAIRVHHTIPMGSAILLDHKEPSGRIQIESKVYKAPPRMSFAFEVVRTGSGEFYETLAKGYDDLVADGNVWDVNHSGKAI